MRRVIAVGAKRGGRALVGATVEVDGLEGDIVCLVEPPSDERALRLTPPQARRLARALESRADYVEYGL